MSVRHNGNTIISTGFRSVNLTQAEYDALPNSKLTDGVYYNITDDESEDTSEFVSVVYQNLTDEQKAQARSNIGAIDSSALNDFSTKPKTHNYGNNYDFTEISTVGIADSILSVFNATSNYNSFQGSTGNGYEAGFIGFKHTTYGQGVMFSRGNIVAFYINNSTVTGKIIFSF